MNKNRRRINIYKTSVTIILEKIVSILNLKRYNLILFSQKKQNQSHTITPYNIFFERSN